LVDFVRQQVGEDHPLVDTLGHGVGFHHAGLPSDVLEELEEAVRDDRLPYLVCTSTLTDGVNLPVRTVVIVDHTYQGQDEDAQLRGPRLVNAIGRAGRAGKESEGWIILVRTEKPGDDDFDLLAPSPDDLAVTSSLTRPDALDSLARAEAAARLDADSVYQSDGVAADFVSFVWNALSNSERQGDGVDTQGAVELASSTLAATESPEAKELLVGLAAHIAVAYAAAPSPARTRWSRSGMRINSSRTLDGIAQTVAREIIARDVGATELESAIALLRPHVPSLLALPEAPRFELRVTDRGARLDYDLLALMESWLAGESLAAIAERHLSQVTDPSWRMEQLVDLVTSLFEHYLSWALGSIVDLVNLRLSDANSNHTICPELGGYVRFGVDGPLALTVLTSGVRSRRLAHEVSGWRGLAPSDETSLRDALVELGLGGWREVFQASTSEMLDLLDFTRSRERSLLRALVENGVVSLRLDKAATSPDATNSRLNLRVVSEVSRPSPIALFDGDVLVATVSARDHSDVQAILASGLDLTLTYVPETSLLGIVNDAGEPSD
jgi:hypothetical protein